MGKPLVSDDDGGLPPSMRALITGGAGFLGANLARRLADGGADVHVLVRQTTPRWRLAGLEERVHVHVADLVDAAAVADLIAHLAPAFVFHLAAAGGHASDADSRRAALAVSVDGTFNVLSASQACRSVQRVVHVGSFLEYGPRAAALSEHDRLEPATFRGVIKAAATLLCRQAAREGLPVVTLRVFSVYGPWEQPGRLVPTAIRSALTGEPLSLTTLDARHDFIYVGDVVRACVLAASSVGVVGEAINVGSGVETSNSDVIRAVEQAVGRPVPVAGAVFPSRPSDTTHCIANIEKAARLLAWRPHHDLASGLACTVRWQRAALANAASPADAALISNAASMP